MKKKILYVIGLIIVSSVFLFNGCYEEPDLVRPEDTVNSSASNYDSKPVSEWLGLINKLTKETPGFSPPVAARAIGYATVALYESVRSGIPGSRSLVGQLKDLNALSTPLEGKKYHWPTVANSTLAQMAKYFYARANGQLISEIEALEEINNQKYKTEIDADEFNRSKEYGITIANEIYEFSKSDGGHEGYAKNFPDNYTAPAGPGMWVPTPPSYAKALQPFWGNNRPFIKECVEYCQPEPPIEYSTDPNSSFYQQAYEVYEIVKNQTPEQKAIAEFWSDDPGTTATPPGHSISIVNQILIKENVKLDKAVIILAKVGIALNDAFISCWKTKFNYNVLRPVTYIQEQIDNNWMPTLVTPPFPEYASGHSVQTGAVAQILTDTFGENYSFTDYTHADRTDINGTPRQFNSFNHMAKEAAESRLYGGIHYKQAIDLGLEQGYAIGKIVGKLQLK